MRQLPAFVLKNRSVTYGGVSLLGGVNMETPRQVCVCVCGCAWWGGGSYGNDSDAHPLT